MNRNKLIEIKGHRESKQTDEEIRRDCVEEKRILENFSGSMAAKIKGSATSRSDQRGRKTKTKSRHTAEQLSFQKGRERI